MTVMMGEDPADPSAHDPTFFADPIDTGDTVHHIPTDEDWLVAYVRGDRLAWCGWPEGLANLSDCTLTKKATPEGRHKLLLEMAAMGGSDSRASYARARLATDTAQDGLQQ